MAVKLPCHDSDLVIFMIRAHVFGASDQRERQFQFSSGSSNGVEGTALIEGKAYT